MSKEFDDFIADKPYLRIISKENVSMLKIKLGKNHRKESDWTIIKKILYNHDLITVNVTRPVPGITSVEHILCEENALLAFSNFDDCEKHIRYLQTFTSLERYVEVGSIPFETVIEVADNRQMPVYIDLTMEPNRKIIVYNPQERRFTASLLIKN